ncbi:MAG TPA: hypothetical protein VF258_01265, partial [Luteolibacter sp.]
MNAELDTRLKAFNRSFSVLDLPEHPPVWLGQSPQIFTVKRDEAHAMVAILAEAAKKQEAGLGGMTSEKDREETELEDAAFIMAQALVQWFNDHQQETEAGQIAMSKTAWKNLRDQQLLSKSQLVIDHASGVAYGPYSMEATQYGITPDAVELLTKERQDYADIVNAPGAAQAVRKALTKGFRPAFSLVEKKFGELDALIIQFGTTPAGNSMIAAWNDARIQKGNNGDSTPV